jgi:hypothetical protein
MRFASKWNLFEEQLSSGCCQMMVAQHDHPLLYIPIIDPRDGPGLWATGDSGDMAGV